MKYFKPTQMLALSTSDNYWYWSDEEYFILGIRPGVPAIIPIQSRMLVEVEVESKFTETRGHKENFVHHVKPIGSSYKVTPMATSQVVSVAGPMKGKPFIFQPLAHPFISYNYYDIEMSSKVAAWYSIPGYTFAAIASISDFSYGFTSEFLVTYYMLSYNEANPSRPYREYSKLYIRRNGSRLDGWGRIRNTDLGKYIMARSYLVPTWKDGEIGKVGSLTEKLWMAKTFGKMLDDLDNFLHIGIRSLKALSNLSTTYYVRAFTPSKVPEVPETLLNEEFIRDRHDILIGTTSQNYVTNSGIQSSFFNACDSLPTLSDNNISNIIDIVGFMKSLIIDHKINIPNKLQDLWLSYRYVYTTTKLDVEEAISFMSRHVTPDMWDRGIKSYGESKQTFNDTIITFKCVIKVSNKEASLSKTIWEALCKYGLSPDFYAIWDMIPYSFIIDWFIPVGELLSVVDASTHFNSETYNFKSIVYSLKYEILDSNGLAWSCYTRWLEKGPPNLTGTYWLTDNTVSNKTVAMRIIDALALIVKY